MGKESRYVLNVTATDGGIPALSSFCTVYISVAQTCGSACNPLWLHPSSLSTELNVSEVAFFCLFKLLSHLIDCLIKTY